MERYFSKNSDGTVEFTPIAVTDSRYIYDQLRDRLSDLRKKHSVPNRFGDAPELNSTVKLGVAVAIRIRQPRQVGSLWHYLLYLRV